MLLLLLGRQKDIQRQAALSRDLCCAQLARPIFFLLPVSHTNVLPLVPSWLLRYPEIQLRTTHQNFVEAVDKYFDHLIPRILPLQVISVPAHVHQKEQGGCRRWQSG